MNDLIEHFRRLYDYEFRCTALVHEGLARSRENIERVGVAALAAPFERAVQVWSHVQAARRTWLVRLGREIAAPADGLFPAWSVGKARAEAEEMDIAWRGYIDLLDARELARVTRYTSTEGKCYDTEVRDILTHVVNHSSYHRGQIASLIAATGTKPPITDYVFFCRRPVA
jgi:uncharacterized damage-inducible protein DinB